MRDPTGEHTGLARAGPGDDQQRPAAVLDGLALRRVEVRDQVDHLRGPLGLALGPPIGRLGIGTPLGRGNRGAHHVRGTSGLSGARSNGGRGSGRRRRPEEGPLISLAVRLPVHGVGGHGGPREARQQVIREHLWILGARADTAGTGAPAGQRTRTFFRGAHVAPPGFATETDIQYLRPFLRPVIVQERASGAAEQDPATAAPRLELIRASTR